MAAKKALQEAFLVELKNEQLGVSIFLVNGIKLHGIIAEFDNDVILLKNAVTQVVYKHAISTIVPSRSIELSA